MVVAITYNKETAEVGEHFGHAEYFKLYEIWDNKVVESAVIEPFGQGHEAVVQTMEDYMVTVVICRGIGDGAIQGLNALGISVCPNVEGQADDALEAFLNGQLPVATTASCNCSGHDHGGSCGESCGSGCGGCCH